MVLAAVVLAGRALAADFFIHDGDRVVFLGDSITEQRLYTTYIEAYALTRHPQWQLTFRNVGWGGDTAWLRQRAFNLLPSSRGHPPHDIANVIRDEQGTAAVDGYPDWTAVRVFFVCT